MSNVEDLETFKQRVNKQELKRARYTATAFGICACVTLISVVLATFQYQAIGKQRIQAEQNYMQMLEYKKRAEAAEQEASDLKRAMEILSTNAKELMEKSERLSKSGSKKDKK